MLVSCTVYTFHPFRVFPDPLAFREGDLDRNMGALPRAEPLVLREAHPASPLAKAVFRPRVSLALGMNRVLQYSHSTPYRSNSDSCLSYMATWPTCSMIPPCWIDTPSGTDTC